MNREVVLFLDDIALENGKIAPFSVNEADHTLMGRFGNILMINGETDFVMEAEAGEVVRFYLTNAANTRTFNVNIPGVQMKLVGGDNGKYEQESWVDSILLSPSERAVVEVFFEEAGEYSLQHQTPDDTYTLGQIIASEEKVANSFAEEFAVLRTNQDVSTEIDAFRADFEKPVDKRLRLTIAMNDEMQAMMPNSGMSGGGHNSHMMGTTEEEPIEWEDPGDGVNEMSNASMMKWVLVDEDTGKQNEEIEWNFDVGDKIKISIENDADSMHPMQHPIHFHGQRFLVLSIDGEPNENLVWKDTVLIPNGSTVELLVEMSNPGDWMAHCHIAEHLEAGMMLEFSVT